MENEPREREKEPPSLPAAPGTKTRGSAGSPTPRWLWPLVLGGFGFIFWNFAPDASPPVPFSPWFLDQVESDNIKGLLIRGNEIRGQLRTARPYRIGSSANTSSVSQFVTYAPSQDSFGPLIKSLRDGRRNNEPVVIEVEPVSPIGTLLWLLLLLPSILLLVVISLLRALVARSGR
jgi:cell division protease FtsH